MNQRINESMNQHAFDLSSPWLGHFGKPKFKKRDDTRKQNGENLKCSVARRSEPVGDGLCHDAFYLAQISPRFFTSAVPTATQDGRRRYCRRTRKSEPLPESEKPQGNRCVRSSLTGEHATHSYGCTGVCVALGVHL